MADQPPWEPGGPRRGARPQRPPQPPPAPQPRRAGGYAASRARPAAGGPPAFGPPIAAHGPHLSRRARRTLRAVIATVSFVILVVSGTVWVTFKHFSNSVPHGSAVPKLAAGAHDPDGSDENILLVGNDSRAGASAAELKALGTQDDGGSINADTMMVLHIPHDGRKPTVVSFPRDSWVNIPGYGMNKLNAAYPDAYNAAKSAGKSEVQAQSAGLILTIRTIESITGLHIDHYAQVDLLGFYRISNAIGGVPVCLLAPAKDSYSGINLPAGVSVIKGSQALAFVRQRHGLPDGDLDRIKRQQYFLASAFHKVESAGVLLNPFKLHKLLSAVGSSLLTDPNLNILDLAQQFATLSGGNVSYATLPNDGGQTIYPNGVATSIVQVDTAAIPAFIRQLAGQASDPALAKATPAARGSVTVDVFNGTQTANLATRNAAQLRQLGFRTNTVGDTDSTTTQTTLQYPPGQESQVKAMQAVVPHAKLDETSSVQRVTLILGTNGVQVQGLSAPAKSSAPAATKSGAASSGSATSSTPASSAGVDGLGCIN